MAKEYAESFYNSKAWRDTRDSFMSYKLYKCEKCGEVAKIVHHIKHITPSNIDNPMVTLSWDNLMALCQDCHNVIHGGSCTADGYSFNSNGELVFIPPTSQKF